MKYSKFIVMFIVTGILSAFSGQPAMSGQEEGKSEKVTKVWLIGDSTVTDYSLEDDYNTRRYPIMGWGQVFQTFLCSDSLPLVRQIIKTDSAIVDDRARGGRSTRSFFEEGRWSEIYRQLQKGDVVMIQFGHNDASVAKGERYVSLPGYKEFLRLYVSQSREKGAIPVLITPVARNYPWEEGKLGNTHGDYPDAMRSVAEELDVYLIDLTSLSMEFFSSRDQEYVTETYFMNFPAGLYEGYPEGSKDNTHFQPAGAIAVANLVFKGMKVLKEASDLMPPAVYYEGLEFPMSPVAEPVFPDYSVSVADFGAVNDGQTLNTKAFADAISDVAAKGGGKVIIPSGIWLTGPVILKSNINLHTEEGALVIFSPDKDLYPLIETSFEGYNTYRCISPIFGKDLHNIAITGKGIFDGTGEAWRPVKKDKVTESHWKDLVKSGGVVGDSGSIWYPSQSYKEAQEMSEMNVPRQLTTKEDFEKIRDFLRPVMVSLVSCSRVLLDGPGFQNSPAWCIHPLMCEDLTIRNITVKNPWYSQNGDGIDIESCRNTILYNSNFDVGDDAICIKSGKDADGRKRGMPTENLIIRDCIVYHGHGGVTIGSEMSGGVKNMSVSGCTFMGTDVGLRFKSNRGRGGVVEDIYFSDIKMINIPTQAISFNLYYGGLSVSEMLAAGTNIETTKGKIPGVNEETPVFRNISIRNLTCKGAMQGIYLQGLPELNLENIYLEDIDIEAENGMACIDADGVEIRGLRLTTKKSPVLRFVNSKNVDIQGLNVLGKTGNYIEVDGKKSGNIRIEKVMPDGTKTMETVR
ncbi:MAG TPA: glycosyl hydrolase family 28 protein [Bacteroidales bacterium]|nr:glycosyl hydrolase family 28 protein [Bacteroidales bacterium]